MIRSLVHPVAAGSALVLASAMSSPGIAQVRTGPEPALAPGQHQRAAGTVRPSTVDREPDGTPDLLKGTDA